MQNRNILIIDDDRDLWQAYREVLAQQPGAERGAAQELADLLEPGRSNAATEIIFDLQYAPLGQEGFSLVEQSVAEKKPFSVAFIDIRMPPGWDGMETAARIRKIDPNIEIVIVTAYSDRSRREIVENVGTPEKLLFLRKPFDAEELYQLALSLCSKWNLALNEKKTKAVLESSEERFRGLVETTSDWVWEIDANGLFTYCSPVCEEIYGYRPEQLVGKKAEEFLLDPESISLYRETLVHSVREVNPFSGKEWACRRNDGSTVSIESSAIPVVDATGAVISFRGIDRNITKRKQMEEEQQRLRDLYMQSQKLEAIGTLAGGIAHDMNNMLTPIIGYAQLGLMDAKENDPIREALTIIMQTGKKAAGLIKQILTFSRRQPLTLQMSNLNEVITNLMKMLRRLIPEDITLDLDLANDLGQVNVDVGQIEQVLINLIVNARDAVGAHGRIKISTWRQIVDGDKTDVDAKPISGEFCIVEVSDNGHGMDDDTQQRIFDPFYTTKELGKGTGLGLATVYGAVKQHHGHLCLETAPETGTTFSIYLPLAKTSGNIVKEVLDEPVQGGNETILIAEDNATVRRVFVTSLTGLGYSTLEATDGAEALKLFQENRQQVDLLLTDVIMPEIGGVSLAEQCRDLRPGLPVIFVSGYPFDQDPNERLDREQTSFLMKPCTPHDVARTVRSLLDTKERIQN